MATIELTDERLDEMSMAFLDVRNVPAGFDERASAAIQHALDRAAAAKRGARNAMSFPPLPPSPAEVGDLMLQTREHVQALGWGNREPLYTASQVRAVMSECAAMAAARERERGLKELRDAVRQLAALNAWHHFGDCRAWTAGPILSPLEADELARRVLRA